MKEKTQTIHVQWIRHVDGRDKFTNTIAFTGPDGLVTTVESVAVCAGGEWIRTPDGEEFYVVSFQRSPTLVRDAGMPDD